MCDFTVDRSAKRKLNGPEKAAWCKCEAQQHILADRKLKLRDQIRQNDGSAASLAREEELATERRRLLEKNSSVNDLLPQVQKAMHDVRQCDQELAEARATFAELDAAEATRLETSQCIYQVYAAATGIRWDMAEPKHDRAKGYIALGSRTSSAMSFNVSAVSAKTPDMLWEYVDNCAHGTTQHAACLGG